jgi:hypothetical protein
MVQEKLRQLSKINKNLKSIKIVPKVVEFSTIIVFKHDND